MTVLAQHGWGKGNKIARGLESGTVRGVIMSPKDESPDNLASYLSGLRERNSEAELLVDPLFHIGAIQGLPRIGKLGDYPHYQDRLDPLSFSPRSTRSFVSRTLQWQVGLDVTAILSPTVMVDDLTSRWSQVALSLAQETIYQHQDQGEDRPLLISLVVDEDALRHPRDVDDWLDDLTELDTDGFYIVVRRRDNRYQQNYNPAALASLLRVCHSLGERNEYRVIAGYTDMTSLLLHAVGVEGTGTGWYGNLRQFTLSRFQETGGRAPRARYSSGPLLNSIYMYELAAIHNNDRIMEVLSGSPFDERFNDARNPESAPWNLTDSTLHHWWVMNDILEPILQETPDDRLDLVIDSITQALDTYTQVSAIHRFSPDTGPAHLLEWQEAIRRFQGG